MISACAKGQEQCSGRKNMDMAVRAEEFIRTALVKNGRLLVITGTGKPPGGKAG